MTHTSLIHSGTPNRSPEKRYFFSVYYNISWLKHTDTYTGPNCEQLKGWARNNGDHRALRLLGVDDNLQVSYPTCLQVLPLLTSPRRLPLGKGELGLPAAGRGPMEGVGKYGPQGARRDNGPCEDVNGLNGRARLCISLPRTGAAA